MVQAVDGLVVVKETSFYFKKTQPFTLFQLEQQNVKYCNLKFKLENNGEARGRGEETKE